jgi:hypothetical protein
LRDADWVSRRAAASDRKELGGARSWVRHVRLVVGRVEVLAVPACGELDVGSNATFADILGQVLGVDPTVC